VSTRITLDATILSDTPRGWDKATIKSKRDKVINGLFTEYTTDLEFWGDGFDYIDAVIEEGYCNIIDVLIESDDCTPGEFEEDFAGVIPIPQISEVDVDEKILKAKIVDLGYNARISNNKKLKAIVDTGKTKNGFDMTPVTPVDIDFYDPTEDWSDYTYVDRECYRALDCFRFIVEHITDGEVGVVSDLFDVGGACYNLFLVTGFELRQGSGNGEAPDISFEEMFNEISKKKNLAFGIEPNGSGGFNVRIEDDEYFRSNTEAFTLLNVKGIKMGFNLEKMYSSVALGSQQYELATSLSYPPVRLRGFREETFNILGVCNIENELNLISEWIVDSNTIEDVLTNNEEAHDDKIFLIETDGVRAIKYDTFNLVRSIGQTTADAANKLIDGGANFVGDGVTAGDKAINETTGATAEVTAVDGAGQLSLDADIFTANPEDYRILAPPFTYNDGLSNYSSVINWLGALPNSIVKFFGAGNDNFRAHITANTIYGAFPATTNPIVFNDDFTFPNFDDNNNYNPANGQYAIPADGLYAFRSVLLFRIRGNLGADLVTNGDFTSGVGWIGATGGGATGLSNVDWQIGGGVATIGTQRSTPLQVMYQNIIFTGGSKYIVTFDLQQVLGADIRGGVWVATSLNGTNRTIWGSFGTEGTHTINIETSANHNRIEFIAFRELIGGNTYEANFTMDNVTCRALPKFRMISRIRRFNSNLQQLQVFTTQKDISVDFNQRVTYDYVQVDTGAFGAFQDDIMRVDITIEDVNGTGTQVVMLANGVRNLRGMDTHFMSTVVEDGGGELVGVDTTDFVAYTYKFKKPLTLAEFRNIVNNPEYGLVFNRGSDPDDNILSWREDIGYDKQEGMITCNVISKEKIEICQ
jgi:hypothetical protein